MKVREVEVTANVAWSPAPVQPIYLAAGTAAQQLDASFNTSSCLQLYRLNLADTSGGRGMETAASLPVENRFHKIVWGPGQTSNRAGLIAGGQDGGALKVFDADKLIQGESDPVVFSKDKLHTGPVAALDFNPFQHNLLASGASDSEMYIWDMNKPATPMTPGAKSQPPEDVRSVAWNRQVQHILATSFSSRTVVWDLRKNDPIIKVSDSAARMRCKVVAWHPEVATQMCIASEDDHSPVIQIWDLRLASSPLRTLEHHQRGVLAIAWCQNDSDLLLSCGKDDKIVCWNPNANVQGGEVVAELPSGGQWSFDVSWCPRNPGVIAASSFDGKVSVYSLMGGQQSTQPNPQIADSFPGMEMIQNPGGQPVHRPTFQLKNPPKWLKRPCGASFGFGGKLVSFGLDPETKKSRLQLSSVVTDQELVKRSLQLETSLNSGNLAEFCEAKVRSADKGDEEMWKFIGANYSEDPKGKFLQLLGYEASGEMTGNGSAEENKIEAVTNGVANLDAFDQISAKATEDECLKRPFKICADDSGSGKFSKALLTGNLRRAVQLCLDQKRWTDAVILSMYGGQELLQTAQNKYFSYCAAQGSCDSPLIEAVVSGNWSGVVERCSAEENWKEALVAALTYNHGQEHFQVLCRTLGTRLESKRAVNEAMICYIIAGDLDKVAECWMSTRSTDDPAKKTKNLQDLVEVVMLLKSSLTVRPDLKTGPLSNQLTTYATMLSSQGALEAALTYLGESDEESIVNLRERLEGALGSKRVVRRPATVAAPATAPKVAPMAAPASYTAYTGIHNPAAEDLSLYNPPVPHYDHGGITQRRDSRPRNPSMESRPAFGAGYVAPPPVGGGDVHYGYQPPQPLAPAPQPAAPVNIFTPDFSQTTAQPPPAAAMPPPPGADGSYKPPHSSGPGWNDPPPMTLTSKPKAKTVPTAAIHNPITQPLMAMPGVPEPPMGHAMAPAGMPPQSGYPQQMYEPYQHQQPPHAPPPASFMQPAVMGDPAPMTAMPRIREAAAEPPKPKAPIPQEHQVLQDVFDSLRSRCVSAANHPQIRRKLEDVGKKLEVLYDKLREKTLPPGTLQGLHQVKECIWSYDYNSCLLVVNQLVSSGSFSILSTFIPGVKVLIQVASQLGVYLERPRN